MPAAAKFPPGALVVSTSTTVEPTTCSAAVGAAEPLREGVGENDAVLLGVAVGDRDGDGVGVAAAVRDGEEPPDNDAVGGARDVYTSTATPPARPFALEAA
jgi:hypothetical protein